MMVGSGHRSVTGRRRGEREGEGEADLHILEFSEGHHRLHNTLASSDQCRPSAFTCV